MIIYSEKDKPELRWGIDIGGVLMAADTDSDTSFFGPNYLHTPEIDGAVETIEYLCDEFGSANVFLVSKCSEATAERTLEWLSYRHFYEIGFDRRNVLFCRSREEKARLCVQHALSAFVDDRFSVLKYMLPNPLMTRLFLFSPQPDELNDFNAASDERISLVDHWFWITSQLCSRSSPPLFPLPPRWRFVDDPNESEVLARQFLKETGRFSANTALPGLRCVARCDDDILLQTGPDGFVRSYLTWPGKLPPFDPSAPPLSTNSLAEMVEHMKNSSTAFTWPPRGFTLDGQNKQIIENPQ